MVHATFIPQPLEKRDEKHDRNTISTKNSATLGSTKDLSTTSKASPASAPDQLTKEDMSMSHYVSLHDKNICLIRHDGKNIVQRIT